MYKIRKPFSLTLIICLNLVLIRKYVEAIDSNVNTLNIERDWNIEVVTADVSTKILSNAHEDILITNSSKIQFLINEQPNLSGIYMSLDAYRMDRQDLSFELTLLTSFAEVLLCKLLWTVDSKWIILNRWRDRKSVV